MQRTTFQTWSLAHRLYVNTKSGAYVYYASERYVRDVFVSFHPRSLVHSNFCMRWAMGELYLREEVGIQEVGYDWPLVYCAWAMQPFLLAQGHVLFSQGYISWLHRDVSCSLWGICHAVTCALLVWRDKGNWSYLIEWTQDWRRNFRHGVYHNKRVSPLGVYHVTLVLVLVLTSLACHRHTSS